MANQSQTNERIRRYEIGYLVAPTVPEDETEEMAGTIADTVADHGDVLAEQVPEMRELAYTMEATTSAGEREFDRGQFGWIQFAVTPDTLDEIKDVIEDTDDVMRHLLIKIDEEDVGGRDRDEKKRADDESPDEETDSDDTTDEQEEESQSS